MKSYPVSSSFQGCGFWVKELQDTQAHFSKLGVSACTLQFCITCRRAASSSIGRMKLNSSSPTTVSRFPPLKLHKVLVEQHACWNPDHFNSYEQHVQILGTPHQPPHESIPRLPTTPRHQTAPHGRKLEALIPKTLTLNSQPWSLNPKTLHPKLLTLNSQP